MTAIDKLVEEIYEEGVSLYDHKMKNRNGYKHFRNKRQCIIDSFVRAFTNGKICVPKENGLVIILPSISEIQRGKMTNWGRKKKKKIYIAGNTTTTTL